MKKIFCCILLIIFISGCSSSEYSLYEKINRRYYNMPSYKAEGEITYYTNKTENTYSFCQYYNGKDLHLIQYPDDGLKVYVKKDGVYSAYDKDSRLKIYDTDEGYRYIFPDCFFENYYSKETSVMKDNPECVILETENFSKNISYIKMWIDTDTINPRMMEICGAKDKLLCKIKFSSFEYNYNPDDEIFLFE